MLYSLYTCNGHVRVETFTADTVSDVAVRCLELERQRADGYAVYAMLDGRMVADADGPVTFTDDTRRYRAQLDYAAGYRT